MFKEENTRTVVPGRYWKRISEDLIQCDLCPRTCKLQIGQHGACLVRMNNGTQIVLTTYGRSSGICVDPIEKKPLYHFFPGTSTLSFGTAGCNLTCRFCQNWAISKARQLNRILKEKASPLSIAQTAHGLNCTSVSFTYNDPVIFLEYAVDTAQACHALGIRTVAVTAGYITPRAGREFFTYMDAVNVDLKAFTERFYRRFSTAHLAPVLDTLRYLKQETNIWFELTTLLIPDENDSSKEIDAMTRWIVQELGPDVPLHFTAFSPAWKLADKNVTPLETLQRARTIARANGVHHVYTGNVQNRKGESTYCHNCGHMIVERTSYQIGYYALTDGGRCLTCGAVCAGSFYGTPESWGRRRQQIHFSR